MKRDLDLARQLLLDIEARDADCSVNALRTNTSSRRETNGQSSNSFDIEERIRYHLRLLIDGGLLREVDRTTADVPCVRLTHDGHELLELSRQESLWREAKWLCQERTGGESLTVIRTLLYRMATGPSGPLPGTYVRRPRYLTNGQRRPVRNRVRYVRVRPADHVDQRPLEYVTDVESESRYDLEYEGTFPKYLI